MTVFKEFYVINCFYTMTSLLLSALTLRNRLQMIRRDVLPSFVSLKKSHMVAQQMWMLN